MRNRITLLAILLLVSTVWAGISSDKSRTTVLTSSMAVTFADSSMTIDTIMLADTRKPYNLLRYRITVTGPGITDSGAGKLDSVHLRLYAQHGDEWFIFDSLHDTVSTTGASTIMSGYLNNIIADSVLRSSLKLTVTITDTASDTADVGLTLTYRINHHITLKGP